MKVAIHSESNCRARPRGSTGKRFTRFGIRTPSWRNLPTLPETMSKEERQAEMEAAQKALVKRSGDNRAEGLVVERAGGENCRRFGRMTFFHSRA